MNDSETSSLRAQLAEMTETEREIRIIVQAGDRPLAEEVSKRIHKMYDLQREVFALMKERDALRSQVGMLAPAAPQPASDSDHNPA